MIAEKIIRAFYPYAAAQYFSSSYDWEIYEDCHSDAVCLGSSRDDADSARRGLEEAAWDAALNKLPELLANHWISRSRDKKRHELFVSDGNLIHHVTSRRGPFGMFHSYKVDGQNMNAASAHQNITYFHQKRFNFYCAVFDHRADLAEVVS